MVSIALSSVMPSDPFDVLVELRVVVEQLDRRDRRGRGGHADVDRGQGRRAAVGAVVGHHTDGFRSHARTPGRVVVRDRPQDLLVMGHGIRADSVSTPVPAL